VVTPLRIFVSHSSKDNAFTKQVCDAIAGNGAVPDFELLVDLVTLEGGREWPIQLHEMMADCHTALILLTRNAVASEWVLKESTILTWRQSLEEENFRLFIAQAPDVTAAELSAAKFGPLQHRLLQGAPGNDAALIAAHLRAALPTGVEPVETLFDRLVVALSDMLGALDDTKLKAVADKVEAVRPRWRPGGNTVREARIEGIAARILRGQLGQYRTLSALMEDLKASKLSAEILARILRFAAPHWVDVEAAARLGDLVEERNGQKLCRVSALNGQLARDYTGQMYVDRAFPFVSRHKVCAPTPAVAGNEREDYTSKICQFCRNQDKQRAVQLYAGKSDDEIIALLKKREPWLFVIFPSNIDAKELEQLRLVFPRVFFVLATGKVLDPSPHDPVVRLEPAVSVDIEEEQYLDYLDAVEAI
jgi:hypothetical protein